MSGPQPGAGWSQPGEPVDPNVGAPPPPYAYPASYPAPPYPYYGYPPPVSRPGNIVAASALAYIAAGLLLVAALLLFLGASVVNSLRDATTSDGFGTELAVDGILDVILAGLLIAGGVLLTNRQLTGRLLITISAVLCAGIGIYWAVRIPSGGIGFYVVLFVSLPVIAAALAWTPSASQWLGSAQRGGYG